MAACWSIYSQTNKKNYRYNSNNFFHSFFSLQPEFCDIRHFSQKEEKTEMEYRKKIP